MIMFEEAIFIALFVAVVTLTVLGIRHPEQTAKVIVITAIVVMALTAVALG